MVSDLKKFLIKSLPLIAVLFTCVVILSSAAIFASEEYSPSSEVTSWLAPDLDSVQAKVIAEEIYPTLSEGTRAAYDVNDVYLLLNNYFKGSLYNSSESTSSVFPLVRISGYLSEIYDAIFGNASGNNFFDGMHELLTYYDGSRYYSIAELQGMTWARVGDINSSLSLTNSYLNSFTDFGKLSWVNFNASYVGSSFNYDNNYINYVTSGTEFYTFFNLQDQYSTFPNMLRINLPFYVASSAWTSAPILDSIEIISAGTPSLMTGFDWFTEPCGNGYYLYLINFNQRATGELCIHIKYPTPYVFMSYAGASIQYLPFDSYDYQIAKIAFYQNKSANSFGSIEGDVNRLADYLADPDKIAAEQASQGVIDDTLDGFTGSGSAAAKGSDIGSMKNISGSVQNGLNTGGSAGDAASVFSNAQFWAWFTQSTSDGINNPYPAPTVEQRRGSGDEIPDFISGDHEYLENYRNRRDRW